MDGERVQLSKELSAAVDPEEPNRPIPLSRLTPAQMQAELDLRGLQLTGTRKELQRRIQARASPRLTSPCMHPTSHGADCGVAAVCMLPGLCHLEVNAGCDSDVVGSHLGPSCSSCVGKGCIELSEAQ